jgi:hypothetical protein
LSEEVEAAMNAQLDQHIEQQVLPAEWIVALDEDDWPGVNDCGAILLRSAHDPPGPLADEDGWWPGRCIH